MLALGGGGYNRGNLAQAWTRWCEACRARPLAPAQPAGVPRQADSATILGSVPLVRHKAYPHVPQDNDTSPVSIPSSPRAIEGERRRQEDHIELIASENYASPRVLEAQGSVLTNKYAEGYPGKRYYGGCEYVDIAEQLAIDRAEAAVRRRLRQRAAAFRLAGQRRGVLRAGAARATPSSA